jgi:hypothetical protein
MRITTERLWSVDPSSGRISTTCNQRFQRAVLPHSNAESQRCCVTCVAGQAVTISSAPTEETPSHYESLILDNVCLLNISLSQSTERRSQRLSHLRHKISSPAQTQGSWFRNQLDDIFLRFSVFVASCR